MLGTFQQSSLRIEISATSQKISDSLLQPNQWKKWLWTQQFPDPLPDSLTTGITITSWMGVIPIEHYIDVVDTNCLRLILSKGIDGYHEWYWGDGWVQSRIEGISILPLKLGQSFSLFSLKEYVKTINN